MRTLTRLTLALILGVAPPMVSSGMAQAPREDQVKAAFLLNFAKFVEWPLDAFADGAAPIAIGIVGDDPFGGALNEVVRGKTINRHTIVVTRIRAHDDFSRFHIVFISQSEKGQVGSILQRLGASRVLTVSEIQDFCQMGGVIALVTEEREAKFEINARSSDRRPHLTRVKSVRFEINIEAAEGSGLKISSRLLTLAKKVHTKGE